MSWIKTNLYFKIGAIVFIALLLLIPTAMIQSLIQERENYQSDAVHEVSSKWGEEQTITGPILEIPYKRYVRETSGNDTTQRVVEVRDHIYVLPEQLSVTGTLKPEARHRGIYEVVLYESGIQVQGRFGNLPLSELDIPREYIQFDKAHLIVGISDMRGIEKEIAVQWNGQRADFNPGVVTEDVVASGVNVSVSLRADSSTNSFSFNLDLKGSQFLHFVPVGKVTDIRLQSNWANPSFSGSFLPDEKTVSETGFNARWNVLHLNRNYPQVWTGQQEGLAESAFGVNLLLPVDRYQKTYRTVHYAILFIAFTFLTFFFIEVLNRVFIHPVQYILVGIALIVFYTLLLSLSEHIGFNASFILSALATLVLVTGYVRAILRSMRLALVVSGILLLLYAFIFVIIQLQDYALLLGSIGLFIILAVVMYFSRKIDWYGLSLGAKEPKAPAVPEEPRTL
jgi:inner membrane protein